MKKRPMGHTNDSEPVWQRLRAEAAKLRALAYLIEHENGQGVVALDRQEIQSGLGMLLDGSARRVCRAAKQLEALDLSLAEKLRPKNRQAR